MTSAIEGECILWGPVILEGRRVPVHCIDARCLAVGACAREEDYEYDGRSQA